jgi:REP element-mobilizing transposase RayT
MKQLSMFPKAILVYGGTLVGSRRKSARPLAEDRPLHVVLKASKAVIYANRRAIYDEIRDKAAHFGLKAYGIAVNHDHVHLVLRIIRKEFYHAFIRALTGVLARRYGKGLWKLVPFSRVASWGKDFKQMIAYCKKNREEAAVLRAFEPRQDWYKNWKHAWTEPVAA